MHTFIRDPGEGGSSHSLYDQLQIERRDCHVIPICFHLCTGVVLHGSEKGPVGRASAYARAHGANRQNVAELEEKGWKKLSVGCVIP
jgi:hypothetical protein